MPDEVVATWFGVLRYRARKLVARNDSPLGIEALQERIRARLDGERTPEEERALADWSAEPLLSRDRRLGLPSLEVSSEFAPLPAAPSRAAHREALLAEAARRLREGWDPSVHVDEAIRSVGELDHILNLLGERLVSWSGRDGPPPESEASAAEVARRLRTAGTAPEESELPAGDPALREARGQLAGLYESVSLARSRLERGIEEAMPRRAPNLSALLGPLLAARIVSQAGGLERLARLPASTVQVLGAERAFFEHLRGRAPPPRHGWLFLHPDVQGAPKRLRGRIARALAGKAAIAARLDSAQAPLRPELAEAFRRRAAQVRATGTGPGKGRPGGRRPPTPST